VESPPVALALPAQVPVPVPVPAPIFVELVLVLLLQGRCAKSCSRFQGLSTQADHSDLA